MPTATTPTTTPTDAPTGCADTTQQVRGTGQFGQDAEDAIERCLAKLRNRPVYGTTRPTRYSA